MAKIYFTKGEFLMTKFRWFIFLLLSLALIALFAAGQLFQILPLPEVCFWGSIATIAVLLIGYWFGRKKENNNNK